MPATPAISAALLCRAASLLASIFPLLVAAPLAAQARTATVTGVVRDVNTNEPVPRAIVELRGIRRSTTANEAGEFTLRHVPLGEHVWTVSRIGYATWEQNVSVEADVDFVIGLLATTLELEELVVAVNRTEAMLERRRLSAATSVRLIDGHEIRTSGATTAADVVSSRAVPMRWPCPGEVGGLCVSRRGRVVRVVVFIDEVSVLGDPMDALRAYSPHELHSIESYAGGSMVRVYTRTFVETGRRRFVRPLNWR